MTSPSPVGGLSFRIAAILICMTCIFYMAVMKSFNKKRLRGRLFMVLLILTVFDCCTGIVSTIVGTSNASQDVRIVVTYICKFLYYLTHMAFTPILAIYMMMVCDVFHRLNKVSLFMFVLPFILLEIAVLSNPFTEYMFARYDGLDYARGRGIYIAYAISALYVLYSLFRMARDGLNMNGFQKVAVMYFFVLAFVGTIVQMIYPEIVCELLGEALGLMGIMIMIEKDDYRRDYRTRASNRAALIQDLKKYIAYGRHFSIICARIENAEIYRRIMGNDVYDLIMAGGADFLGSIDYRYEVYRTTGGTFFILCPETTDEDVDRILDVIQKRFDKGFDISTAYGKLNARVLCAKCPEELQEVDDILLLADTEIEGSDKVIIRGEDLSFMLRKVEVEKAIVRGLNGDSFKVMYQPVYIKDTGDVRAAEALLTLNDKLLGELDFDEFMKVSDETGFVEELEFRMVESVCKFIKEFEKKDVPINVIIVHIMSLQVLRTDLIDKVRNCIEKYNIWSARLIFSISDNIALQAQEVVKKIIDEFDGMGVKFSLSNHSTGFGGLDVDLVDRFIGISIDLKRHFENIDSDQAEIILQNRISMIRQLGKAVIVSGISTEKQYNLVQELQVDMMNGSYLSDRVTKEELVNRAGTKNESEGAGV